MHTKIYDFYSVCSYFIPSFYHYGNMQFSSVQYSIIGYMFAYEIMSINTNRKCSSSNKFVQMQHKRVARNTTKYAQMIFTLHQDNRRKRLLLLNSKVQNFCKPTTGQWTSTHTPSHRFARAELFFFLMSHHLQLLTFIFLCFEFTGKSKSTKKSVNYA